MEDVFLYIIWNNAYPKKTEILNDIKTQFEILKTIEIVWSDEHFADNINRFYGKKLPKNSFKERACGHGPFTLVVIRDTNPIYEDRLTTRGEYERVNKNTFDKKMLYRGWTNLPSGNNCIHGTNTPEETEHDLTLLVGLCPEDFLNNLGRFSGTIHLDLAGCDGWKSLEELFYVLGHTCKYCFLRNFEGMPNSFTVEGHEDIDLITDSYDEIQLLTKATPVFEADHRVLNTCNINGSDVKFDFRYVGDNYYDEKWEKNILECRKKHGSIFVPDEENYKYMILYHALVQKPSIAENYIRLLDEMFGRQVWGMDVLKTFLNRKGYRITEPNDISVFFNEKTVGRRMSLVRKMRVKIRNLRRRFLNAKV